MGDAKLDKSEAVLARRGGTLTVFIVERIGDPGACGGPVLPRRPAVE